MRPRVLRRRLILAGLGGMLATATITTGVAKADPALNDYVITNAHVVCSVLDSYPSVGGVEGIVMAVIQKGFTPTQAGEIVARSVVGWCPEHADEIEAFVAKWAPGGRMAA